MLKSVFGKTICPLTVGQSPDCLGIPNFSQKMLRIVPMGVISGILNYANVSSDIDGWNDQFFDGL